MPKTPPKSLTMTISVEEDLKQDLNVLARVLGTNVSELSRRALSSYIEEWQKTAPADKRKAFQTLSSGSTRTSGLRLDKLGES